MQTLHALRQIGAEEEVTVSYIQPGMPLAGRVAFIRRKFDFSCTCQLCSLSGAALQVSDGRQLRICEIDATLKRVGSEQPLIMELIKERARLLEGEGMPREWCFNEMVMAFTHLCKKNEFERARKLMLRAIKAARTILGADSKVVKDLIAIIQEG